MSTARSRLLRFLLPLALVLVVSAPSADRTPMVAGDLIFSALDGSSEDLDAVADGVWTVPHSMVLEGRLACGQESGTSACDMRIEVRGDLAILRGASIETRGNLSLEAAGDLLVREGASVVADRGRVDLSARGRLEVDGLVSAAGAKGEPARVSLQSLGEPGKGVHVGTWATVLATGEAGQAGQVAIAGCGIEIHGLIASLGSGAPAAVTLASCEGLAVDGRDLSRDDGTRRGSIQVQGGPGSAIRLAAEKSVLLDGTELEVAGGPQAEISVVSERGDLSWRYGRGSLGSDGQAGKIRLTACLGIETTGTELAPGDALELVEACGGEERNDSDERAVPERVFAASVSQAPTGGAGAAPSTCTPNLAVDNMTISSFAEFISCNVLTSSNTRIVPRGRVIYRALESIELWNGFSVEGSSEFTAILDPTLNQPPSITSDGGGATAMKSVPENTTAVTDVDSTDPEGDTEGAGLTYSLTGGADQAKFSIVAATGVLTFTVAPDFDAPGDADMDNKYQVTVTVTDSVGLTDSQAITVTVTDVNDPPTITSSAMQSAPENQSAVATLTATDQDMPAQTLTWMETGGADAGLLSITAGGVLTFDAAPDFETKADANTDGVYEIDVKVDDGAGGMATQTVLVTVTDVNEAPVLDPVGNKMVNELVPLMFTATATDVDMPANTLTFSLAGAVPAGASITAGGVFSWTPSEAQGPGVFMFDVVVTDDGTPNFADSETITVTVSEVNVAPVLDPVGDKTVDELVALGFTATSSDVDVPANTLTFSLSGAVPAGASITAGGVFSWTPTEAQGPGMYTFDVVVTDNGVPNLADSETITVTVNEVNVAPVLDPVGNKTVDELVALGFTATASDVDLPANTLTFSLSGMVPAGASITAGGVFSWTPTEAQGPGMYTFDVVVTDNGAPNLADSETITVTVNEVNVAPVLDPVGNKMVAELVALGFTATASDADVPANTLTFSLAAGGGAVPAGASITAGGVFSWTPTEAQGPGMFTFDVVVTDNGTGMLSDSETITVTVTEVNLPPTITSMAAQMAPENQTAVATLTAMDVDVPAQTLSWMKTASGGADGAFFSITAGGVLTFDLAPDFETKMDANADGVYEVEVQVSDGAGGMAMQTVLVTVTNVNEAPVLAAGLLKFIEVEVDGVGGVAGLGGVEEVAVSGDGKHVYTVSSGGGGATPSLVAFSRNALTGELTFLEAEVQGTGGVDGLLRPAAVEVSSDGRHVYVVAGNTDFLEATAAVFGRDVTTGLLTFVQSLVLDPGIVAFGTGLSLSPDGRHVYASTALPSQIRTYARDLTTGQLTFLSLVQDNVGGVDGIGAMQAVRVSPDGRHVYATGPDDDAVAVFSRDVSTGALTFLGLEQNGVDGVDGLDFAIDLALSRDGLHLYAADLASNAIAVFSRNSSTGDLTFVEVLRQGVGGVDGLTDVNAIWVSEEGEHLYATNATNDQLAAFGRNAATGMLTFLGLETDGADGVDGLDSAVDATVSPDGRHVFVAGKNDDALAVFSRQDHLVQYPMAGGPISILDTGIDLTVTDIDSTMLTLATVTITPNTPVPDPGMELLAATASGAILAAEINYVEPTLTILPAAPAPLADFQAVLRSVTYDNTAATPANTTRNVTTVVNDGALDSNVFTTMLMFNTAPMAVDDAYKTLGNTLLEVDLAAPSGAPAVVGEDPTPALYADVLDNDTDAETPAGLTAAVVPASVTAGAVVAMNPDGSFSYTPPVGFTGMDTFDYEVSDPGGLMDTGTVEVTVSSLIWFVDKDNAGTADGRSATPFTSLAPVDAGGANDGQDGNGDTIFVFDETTGSTSGGILLETNQILHGNGVALDFAGFNFAAGSVLVASSTAPTIEDTAGDVIVLASGNTVRGLDIAATNGRAIFGNNTAGATFDDVGTSGTGTGTGVRFDNATGTISITDLDVNSSTGPGIDIQGGSATFTFDAASSITSPSAAAFNVSGGTASVAYPGSITQANNSPAVSIVNHATGTIGFGGAINATNGTGLQFSSAAGVYNVTTMSGTTTLNGGDAGIDILTGSSGTFTFGNTSITDPTGIGFQIDTSTAGNVDYNGTISKTNIGSPNSAVRINAKTGGVVTFAGAITANTASATGIDLTSNGGGTFNFNGGLNIDTSSGTGFNATGGILNVTGTNNIDSTTGTALNMDGVTIGGSNMTFATIDKNAAGGASVGIDINNVDGGTFSVTGSSTIAGTAAGASNHGIDITGGSSAAFTFASATIDNTGGAGINLSGANGVVTFTTVDIDGTTGAGIDIASNPNAVNINGGSIGSSNDPAGNAVDIAGGSGNVTVAATINNQTGRAVEVTGRMAGTVAFSAAIDEDGTGINLTGNTGSTINFSGGMTLDTGASTAFNATGGGTVNVTGTNTIGATTTSTTTAVNIQNTTIGGSGVTFQSVSVNGGTIGIDVNNAGTGGFFTVTGVGSTDGSGGTIQNTSQNGILIRSTNNITLNNLNLFDAADDGGAATCSETVFTGCNAAVEFDTVSVVDITNMSITNFDDHGIFGQTVTDLDITNTDIDGLGADVGTNEHGIFIRNLLGTTAAGTASVFNNLNIDDAQDTAIRIQNTTATNPGNTASPDLLSVINSTLTDAGDSGLNPLTFAANGNLNVIVTGNTITNTVDGVSVVAEAGNLQATVGGAGALANTISAGAGGDMVNGIRFFSSASMGAATVNATATNNNITLDAVKVGGVAPVSGLNGIGVSAGGASSSNLGTIRATVNDNTINSSFSGILTQTVHGVITTNEGTGTTSQNVISIDNNTITLNPATGTATAETVGVGVDGGTTGAGTTVRITDNPIVATGDASNGASVGIQILPTEVGEPTGTGTRVCTRVTGNNVSTPNNPFAGAFGTTELDVIVAPVQAGSFLDVEATPLGVRTPAQIKADLEPLNTNTEVGDATGSVGGVITNVASCPN